MGDGRLINTCVFLYSYYILGGYDCARIPITILKVFFVEMYVNVVFVKLFV